MSKPTKKPTPKQITQALNLYAVKPLPVKAEAADKGKTDDEPKDDA